MSHTIAKAFHADKSHWFSYSLASAAIRAFNRDHKDCGEMRECR
ncbi:hypothetical protein [Novosphingobium panipatense]|nr:hypothetical protein [Novosphingobium panipatense]